MSNSTHPTDYITYDIYDSSRITSKQPETRDKPVQHMRIPVQYNMANSLNESCIKPFLVEGPECISRWGISSLPDQKKPDRINHSIVWEIEKNNSTHIAFVDFLKTARFDCAKMVEKYKLTVMPKFKLDNYEHLFPDITYEQLDKKTGLPTGREFVYFKLNDFGLYKTIFALPDGTFRPWSDFYNVTMSYIPLFEYSHIYIGGGR